MSAAAIGVLRARVTLESPVRTPDEIGGAGLGWQGEGAVWAEIQSAAGSESADFDGAGAVAPMRVFIRMRRDVRPGWRLAWGARRLGVRAIADADARGARLMLSCEEEFL